MGCSWIRSRSHEKRESETHDNLPMFGKSQLEALFESLNDHTHALRRKCETGIISDQMHTSEEGPSLSPTDSRTCGDDRPWSCIRYHSLEPDKTSREGSVLLSSMGKRRVDILARTRMKSECLARRKCNTPTTTTRRHHLANLMCSESTIRYSAASSDERMEE